MHRTKPMKALGCLCTPRLSIEIALTGPPGVRPISTQLEKQRVPKSSLLTDPYTAPGKQGAQRQGHFDSSLATGLSSLWIRQAGSAGSCYEAL